jgi:hypothetical protein
MKVIYIAGRYRDKRGEYYVRMNIREAEHSALHVWHWGGAAICPHKNTAGFGGAFGISDETWLEGALEIMRRCDAVWMLPGWESSEGAKQEKAVAEYYKLPLLYNEGDVYEFLKGGE